MRGTEFVLVDVSNSFTKIALSSRRRVGRIVHVPTNDLDEAAIGRAIGSATPLHAVVSSVVPSRNPALDRALPGPICWVGPRVNLGIGIDYPRPRTIGADRLANAAGCAALFGAPAIVVDFGTAVTFDVLSAAPAYVGGVIAPGLDAMRDYLHVRTALLPLVTLREPSRAVGRTTRDAMISGAVHGYRGLVRNILSEIRREAFPGRHVRVIATGGHAPLIAKGVHLFDAVAPRLTLEGLRVIGGLNFVD